MSDRQVFNGLDGASGRYLLAPMTDREIGRALLRLPVQAASTEHDPFRGLAADVDSRRLDEAGWGLVLAGGADERFADKHGRGGLRHVLRDLCRMREEEAGALYAGDLVLRAGESAAGFLARYGLRLEDPVGPVPGKIPYYLLLVGGPEEIPYSVQYDLDLQYAVGRICFDTPEEYAAYAEAVVAAEEGRMRRRRQVAFFAVENAGDVPTARAADELVRPLAANLAAKRGAWQVRTLAGAQARRADLADLLRGAEGPALLFTSSHGVGFARGDERQAELQGALVCQDWPGPCAALSREHYFAAPDLGDARVGGLVAFLFACYGAGTPRFDSFVRDDLGRPVEIAPVPRVSRLPQRLLSHPGGAALAVIGHVDRAWTHSFSDGANRGPQIGAFESLMKELLDGERLGAAMEYFGRRYGALGARMATLLRSAADGIAVEELGSVWRAMNDAQNFVVFGDPAVRLAVGDAGPVWR